MTVPYAGELLIQFSPFMILTGLPWLGGPAPVFFIVPSNVSLVGLELYVQGALIDSTPGAVSPIGLTDALKLTIGS